MLIWNAECVLEQNFITTFWWRLKNTLWCEIEKLNQDKDVDVYWYNLLYHHI